MRRERVMGLVKGRGRDGLWGWREGCDGVGKEGDGGVGREWWGALEEGGFEL